MDCTYFASEGIQTPVLKVEATGRIGEDSFYRSLLKGLKRIPGIGGEN